MSIEWATLEDDVILILVKVIMVHSFCICTLNVRKLHKSTLPQVLQKAMNRSE